MAFQSLSLTTPSANLDGADAATPARFCFPCNVKYDYTPANVPLPTQPSAPTFSGTVRYVGSVGGDYATVAAAITAASAGDIIEVRAGYTSTEAGTVTISKSLEIRGADRSTSIIGLADTTIASGSNGLNLPQATINVATNSTTNFANSGTILVVTSGGAQTVTYTGKTASSFTGCSGGSGTMSTGNSVFPTINTLSVSAGVNNVYVHNLTVKSCVNPQADAGGTSTCITAATMTQAYQSGSSGLYFSNLSVFHPKIGFSMQGNGFVIENCTFNGNQTTTIAAGSNGQALPQGTINVGSTVSFTTTGSIFVVTSAGTQTVAYTGKTATSFTGCTGGTGTMTTGGAVTQNAGTTLRPVVNYGQTGNCFVKDCTITASPDPVTPRTMVAYVTANNPGAGTFVPGHQGNYVFKNVVENGNCNAYYVQDVFHQPDTRNGSNYQNAPTPGSLGLWFDGCTFNGQWSGNSITFSDAVQTTVAAGSNGQSLPQASVNVASTLVFPATGSFRVNTTAGVQTVTYTGKTSAATTIASGSNGQSLPQGTINVASAAAFLSAGTLRVTTNAGVQTVTYTGKTATSFTGCSGGTGTMATGGAVAQEVFTGCSGGTGTLATNNDVWNLDTLNFFSRIYVNNCVGQSRTAGDNKGFIAVGGSGGTSRLVGAPTVAFNCGGTNTFNSTIPSATYAEGSTTDNLFGVLTTNFAVPSPLIVAAPTSSSLSGLGTVDGVALQDGYRVFVANTVNAVNSGIYSATSGNWYRSQDMKAGDDAAGDRFTVTQGTTYANTNWVCTNSTGNGIVGTNALSFAQG